MGGGTDQGRVDTDPPPLWAVDEFTNAIRVSRAQGRLAVEVHAANSGLQRDSRMSKSPRVIFKTARIAEGDWQIQAHCPGAESKYVTGFKSKAEVDEWLSAEGKIRWLRSHGYAK